jgi:FkbM family methyltransferase
MQILKSSKKTLRSLIIGILNKLPFYIINEIYKVNWIRKRYKIDFEKTFNFHIPPAMDFKFIQIGGNDGLSFDNLFEKITSRNSQGIILEPSPKYFDKLESNYRKLPNITLINKAIHPTESRYVLYEVNNSGLNKLPEWGQGIGSFNLEHLKNKNLDHSDISKVEVDCISFNQVLSEYIEYYKIDFLQIDTEGFDGEILKSIDFTKFESKMIKFENCHLPSGDLVEVKKLLVNNGYYIFDEPNNSIALKNPRAIYFA